ncbi:hypothetical protein, partial [Klebsiella pneumoniae]|uniref:hypothetical protein n=1 Tax=Klebsiella pneumoniae TaxID=573 RepID=UPI00202DD7D6
KFVHSGLQPPFAQNGTVVNLRMSTRFCTKGDGFQFLAKFAILPQNANSPTLLVARFELNTTKEMTIAFKRFDQSGINVKGCILNGIVKKASSYYGYGYHHYGYSYKEK